LISGPRDHVYTSKMTKVHHFWGSNLKALSTLSKFPSYQSRHRLILTCSCMNLLLYKIWMFIVILLKSWECYKITGDGCSPLLVWNHAQNRSMYIPTMAGTSMLTLSYSGALALVEWRVTSSWKGVNCGNLTTIWWCYVIL